MAKKINNISDHKSYVRARDPHPVQPKALLDRDLDMLEDIETDMLIQEIRQRAFTIMMRTSRKQVKDILDEIKEQL